MKIFTLSILLLFSGMVVCATNYYSLPTGSPSLLTSWNTQRDGSGLIPVSFTTPGDVFLIQGGHTKTTTADWTFGTSTSSLVIEDNGVLQGDHAILLTGIFRIFNGGHYIHNNTAAVSTVAGASIFGGTAIFSDNAIFTIANWIDASTPLPPGIDWPNLIIDYTANLGSWNQQGNLLIINGDFTINHTGASAQEFQLTNTQNLTLNIAGNLVVNGGILRIKNDGTSGFAFVNVNAGIQVNAATIELGDVNIAPNLELRFKGNLVIAGGSINASTVDGFLVANGTSSQALTANVTIASSFRVAPMAIVAPTADITMGIEKNIVIGGTFNAGSHQIIFGSDGKLIVAGGVLNSTGNINMLQGVCAVCKGDGSYTPANDIPWCALSGTAGKMNYSGATILFNKLPGSAFLAGALGSAGEVHLAGAKISFTASPGSNTGSVELTDNSILDLDETSVIEGSANYSGNGGTLGIADPAGINTSGSEGNILVTGSRNYDNGGTNNYEYKGTNAQSTGNGLPVNITGSLSINNSGGTGAGVQLTNSTTIASGGSFQLVNGTLLTNNSTTLTLNQGAIGTGGSAGSFIDGPVIKKGNDDFTFAVGKQGKYSPLAMEKTGSNADDLVSDVFRAEYFPGNPKQITGPGLGPNLNRISELEYWKLDRVTGGASKKITFSFGLSSVVSNPSALVVAFYDGSLWLNAGQDNASGSSTAGTISKALDNFGFFTFGSIDGSNTLPVKLKSFTGRKQDARAILKWEIDEAHDAAYFEILASANNRNYSVITKTNAAGAQSSYEYADESLKKDIVYYRLRITDKDGSVALSKIVPLLFGSNGLRLIAVSPAIAADNTVLTIASSESVNVIFSLTNSEGKLLRSFTRVIEEGSTAIAINAHGLPAGMYFISAFSANGKSNVIRLIKK